MVERKRIGLREIRALGPGKSSGMLRLWGSTLAGSGGQR